MEPTNKETGSFLIVLKVFARFLKLLGLVVFGISLGFIFLVALLQVNLVSELSLGLIAGVVLIIIGLLFEQVT